MEKFVRLQPAGKKEKIIKNAFKWDIRFNNILAHIFLQNSKFSFYWDRKVLPFMYVEQIDEYLDRQKDRQVETQKNRQLEIQKDYFFSPYIID